MDSYAPILEPSLYTMLFGTRQGAQRKKRVQRKRGQRGGNPIQRYLKRKEAETLKKRRERFKQVQWKPRKKPKKKKQRGQGIGLAPLLKGAVQVGVKLGRSPDYRRMGALGATGVYKRHPRPWEK